MKNLKLATLGLVLINLTACAMAQSPVTGFIYTNTKSDGLATEAYGGSAWGEACATSILGWIGQGDASIDAAKKSGGVVQITAVDHTAFSVLGLYAKYCTIVYGKKGNGGAPASKG